MGHSLGRVALTLLGADLLPGEPTEAEAEP